MKILLITTLYPAYLNQGKNEVSYAVHYFAKEWSKDHEVEVVRLYPVYPRIFNVLSKGKKRAHILKHNDNFVIDNVKVKRIPICKIPRINYSNRVIKIVSDQIMRHVMNKPDVIVCDIMNPSIFIGLILSKRYGSRLVASLHNSDINYLKRKKNYQSFLNIYSSIDNIIFRSNKVQNDYWTINNGDPDSEKYGTVLFGINAEEMLTPSLLEKKFRQNNTEIVTASSLIKLKNTDVLIKAFAALLDKYDLSLRIIGDGPEKDNLVNLAKKMNCDNSVFFEGYKSRDDVLKMMTNADVFAMVSSPETFGLVYIEAMARGCISIGAKGEGIDGVIVDNENGFLCIPGSVPDLTKTLEKAILLNNDEKKRILTNAQQTAGELSFEKLAQKFLDIIKRRL